jgi:hypothetical protein
MIDRAVTNVAPALLLTARDAVIALAIREKILWKLSALSDTIPTICGGGKRRTKYYPVADLQAWLAQYSSGGAQADE